jgi:hypothetical protein
MVFFQSSAVISPSVVVWGGRLKDEKDCKDLKDKKPPISAF